MDISTGEQSVCQRWEKEEGAERDEVSLLPPLLAMEWKELATARPRWLKQIEGYMLQTYYVVMLTKMKKCHQLNEGYMD